MSVAPRLIDLPPHRVPERLAHLVEGATGPDSDRVWVFHARAFSNGPFARGLALRVTSSFHGVVVDWDAALRTLRGVPRLRRGARPKYWAI
jgi:hypothetical protein